MTRFAGIDPGSETGIVVLDVPNKGTLDGSRWVLNRTVKIPSRVKLSRAERDSELYVSVRDALLEGVVDHVIIEEPSDAKQVFGAKQTGRGAKMNQGTIFGVGKAYGLALAAARATSCVSAISSYRTTSRKAKPGRSGWVGWMQLDAPTPTPRVRTLSEMRWLAEVLMRRRADGRILSTDAIRAARDAMSEDELMALGVLNFHVMQIDRLLQRDGFAKMR